MSLQIADDFYMTPCKCHVCYKEITTQENAIEHSGHGQSVRAENPGIKEAYVTVWLHPECATVMMLRLANDVMRIKTTPATPRVVDSLAAIVKKRKEHGNT